MDIKEIFTFSFPTDIRFGQGAASCLANEVAKNGVLRPLIVTDQFLASNEVVLGLKRQLDTASITAAIYSGVYGNPDEDQVNKGCHGYREHRADGIIAVGGGASLDVAKAIGLLISNPGTLADYDDLNPKKFAPHNRLPWLLALPTTAGTGSEVGRSTVISDSVTKKKRVIFHPSLLPALVLIDPLLTKALPAPITAATGMDALTHLIESYCVSTFHPMCDGIALEGLRLIGRSFLPAFLAAKRNDQSNDALRHRADMLAASMMGAVAFQKGLGATHSLAHALSTVCDLHHGLANAIMLPHVLSFNHNSVQEKFARIMAFINQTGFSSPQTWVKDLIERLEIEPRLARHGVAKHHIDALVDIAFADGCHATNPRAVTKEDFKRLLESAW